MTFIFEIIQKTLNNQNFNELRQVITLAMAEQGQFIRREHLIDKRPVKKDVELNAEQEQTVKLFSDVWCHIFELFKLRKEYLQVNGLDKGKDAINHWYKLGNTVNRTSISEIVSKNLKVKCNRKFVKKVLDARRKSQLEKKLTKIS